MSLVQMSDPKRHASLSDGSSQMRAIRTMIENIADTDATVLIRGESGGGFIVESDSVLDGSLEGQLDRMRRRLTSDQGEAAATRATPKLKVQ